MNTNSISSLMTGGIFSDHFASNVKNKNVGIFAEFLSQALEKTNSMILEADKISDKFASGLIDDIHQVLIAMEKADIALQFTLQVRNKIIDAYNEIMRMQV